MASRTESALDILHKQHARQYGHQVHVRRFAIPSILQATLVEASLSTRSFGIGNVCHLLARSSHHLTTKITHGSSYLSGWFRNRDLAPSTLAERRSMGLLDCSHASGSILLSQQVAILQYLRVWTIFAAQSKSRHINDSICKKQERDGPTIITSAAVELRSTLLRLMMKAHWKFTPLLRW